MLAVKLPAGARLWIEMGSPDAWPDESYLLAHVVDLLMGANWQRSGGKGKAPKPIDRPEEIHKAEKRREKAAEKAERFRVRQEMKKALPPADPPPNPVDQPRDARGRFVSRKGE